MKNNFLKILYTTPILHYPPESGPSLRVENSIKALSKISNLYLYSRSSIYNIGGKRALDFYKIYYKNVYFSPLSSFYLPNVFNVFTEKIFRKKILPVRTESEEIYRDILRIADKTRANIIWLGYGNLSYPLLKYLKQNSSYKVVLDTDSVWSRFVLRGLPFAQKEKEKTKIIKAGKAKEAEEIWGAKLADVTTAVSEVDASYYRQFVRKKDQVKIFSNVIDLETYQLGSKKENNRYPSLLLSGTFWPGSPMEDAARWFIDKVWPEIKHKIPKIKLYIIGKGSDKVLNLVDEKQIIIKGQVESVLPYFFNASLMVVPLRFESGTRFKILEAGACGIPVVSTTLGAEGLKLKNNIEIEIADTVRQFASSVISLLLSKEKSQTIATNLKKIVRQNYDLRTLEHQGYEIIKSLL
jgi:glycosyltransferase involved in cell wall biosynthesis